ncbi:hypothetical protein D3C81_1835240 [compost metagenome]
MSRSSLPNICALSSRPVKVSHNDAQRVDATLVCRRNNKVVSSSVRRMSSARYCTRRGSVLESEGRFSRPSPWGRQAR